VAAGNRILEGRRTGFGTRLAGPALLALPSYPLAGRA